MRRSVITLALFIAAAASMGGDESATQHDMQRWVIDFEHHHDPFVRDLFGCPPTGTMSDEVCFPRQGRVDAGMYKKARKAAAALYGLKD